MASEFESAAAEVEPLRARLVELEGLADGFGRAMTTAFRRSVVDGKRLEDVFRSIALSLSSRALNAALAPIGQGVGSLFSGLLGSSLFGGSRLAQGDVIGGTAPLAAGGGVARPSFFPMRSGGLAGEAGPETILPLTRGSSGRLGVRTQGGRSVHVTFNVTTPDAASFRRSEADLSAMLVRAVARGQRGM
jgi:phage-related minor tail protein